MKFPTALVLACATCAHALKVTVVGGSGFVGARVCKALVAQGAECTSLSKTGSPPAWAAGESWVSAVAWERVDLLSAESAALDSVMGSPDAVVSCVGVVDSDPAVLRRGNGDANIAAFASAKRAGAKRAVYVSVASEVAACEEAWLPFAKDEFGAYFEGKRVAEAAAADAVGGDATKLCIVKPTFIYGGDKFEVPLPGKFVAPRVSEGYGAGVEEILSIELVTAIADRLPGLIKVALRPPVSADAVAAACAKAALAELTTGDATRRAVGTLDGTAAIRAAAGLLPPTGLAKGLDRALDELGDLTEKFFKEIEAKLDGRGK